jgi:hypothetical protein
MKNLPTVDELAKEPNMPPEHGEMFRRSLKRCVVTGFCWGLIPKMVSQWIFDFFRLGRI